MELPWLTAKTRRRAKRLYGLWVRNRQGGPWEFPESTEHKTIPSPGGDMAIHILHGKKGKGTVVLAHPDRRYGGHWFVREGHVAALLAKGRTVIWFDQPGYGRDNLGSPYLAENVLSAAHFAREIPGPVDVLGVSLGAFATAIAAPYMPWVRNIVLESPYPTFWEWYEGKSHGIGKWVSHIFRVFFRDADQLDARRTLAETDSRVLVTWSESDETTPAALSSCLPATETIVLPDAVHLEFWQQPEYQESIIKFLCASPKRPKASQ